MVEAGGSSNCFAALDLLPDAALSLLASHWGTVNAHASRSSLLTQLRQQLKQSELDPSLEPSLLPQLQLPALFGFSAAVYHDNIYVYGGRSSSDTASSGVRSHLYCYDTAQQNWAAVKQYNTPAPRRWHTSVVHGDCMYIYGGQAWHEAQGEWEACSAISCYCFSNCSWSEAAQAGCGPSSKVKRAAAAVGPTLYVLPAPHGTQSGSGQGYNMLHSFDLENGCWSMRVCFGPDFPDSLQLQLEQLLPYQGSLLAAFSCNPAANHPPQQQQQCLSVYSLSLGDLRWHKLATRGVAPVSRTQSCIALVDDLLLVSGGARPGAAGAEQALLPDLAFLHLPSKNWHSLQLPASSKPARACHAAAVMPGGSSICLLGGWHELWPQPAPSLVLQQEYVRKQQQQQQQLMQQPDSIAATSSSRPVVNTELRTALFNTASSSNSNSTHSTISGSDTSHHCPTNSSAFNHSRPDNNSSSSCDGKTSFQFSRSMPFCDVTITSAEGDAFSAHRFILAAQSPVFEAMLLPGGMSEAASGCVALPDISSAALEALLGYMYGGLPGGVPRELVLEVFSAADRFLLPGLAGECVLQLLGCLSAENVSLIADLASTHRLQELWQACVSFAASPEVQLQVFNSAAYAAMWRDSANTAQAFTAQVAALSQQALSRMKQQLPATGTAEKEVTSCLLPPLQQADEEAAGMGLVGHQHAGSMKRQRPH